MSHTRESVYAAEQQLRKIFDNSVDARTIKVHGSTLTIPIERKFANLDSIQTYVDRVLSLNWVKNQYRQAAYPIHVRERRGQAAAHYEPHNHVIAIPPHDRNRAWAMRELVVLHEISHHLDLNGGHSASFAGIFVNLVTEIIGVEAGFLLNVFFNDEHVAVA